MITSALLAVGKVALGLSGLALIGVGLFAYAHIQWGKALRF